MKKIIIILVVLFLHGISSANMLNIPDTYGMHSSDSGTAKAFSLFADGFSAAYYNPAGLAQNSENHLSLDYIYAKPQLKINDTVAFSGPNEVGILGLKINLSNITTLNKKLSLGIILGVDKNFQGLLTIVDKGSESGQFLRYGRGQMLLIPSVGLEAYKGVFVGAGAYVSVKAAAEVEFDTTLAGDTSGESLEMKGKTFMAPIVGVLLNPGTLLDNKALDKISIALAYRGTSNYVVRVKAQATATLGDSPLATIPLDLLFLDAFVPQQLELGVKGDPIKELDLTVSAGFAYYMWDQLDKFLKNDVVKNSLNLDFANVFSPKIGVEYGMADSLKLRAGYSLEPSPLKTERSPGVNLIDSTRHVVGVGAGYTFNKIPLLKYPLSADAAYQMHLLSKRGFTLEQSDGSTLDVDAGGFVNSLNMTLTVRF